MQEVNNLLRQYAQMKKMFKQMGKPSFARQAGGNEDCRECEHHAVFRVPNMSLDKSGKW